MAAPSINILPCFENIINIRGLCENEDSKSGLYANDIDINRDFLEAIITRQFSGPLDFHERKLAFAIKQVVDQVLTFMQPNFRTNTLLESFRIGQHQDNLSIVAGDANFLKGINVDLWNCNSYLDFFLQEISLQLTVTGNVDVKIYDLIQGKLLNTITVACVANEMVKAYPQLTIKSDRQKLNLFIGYDSTGISSNTTTLRSSAGCTSCNTSAINNPYEHIAAVKIDTGASKVKNNLRAMSETGGLSIVHSLSCNHESWLCSFSKIIAMPILYRYGIEVMEFALNVSPNDRINTTLNINTDEIKSRRDTYQRWYNESFADKIQNIKTPSDKECFTCRENVRHAISIG